MKVINRKHWGAVKHMARAEWSWDIDTGIWCNLIMDDRIPLLVIVNYKAPNDTHSHKVPFDVTFKHQNDEMMLVTEQVYDYLRIGYDLFINGRWTGRNFARRLI